MDSLSKLFTAHKYIPKLSLFHTTTIIHGENKIKRAITWFRIRSNVIYDICTKGLVLCHEPDVVLRRSPKGLTETRNVISVRQDQKLYTNLGGWRDMVRTTDYLFLQKYVFLVCYHGIVRLQLIFSIKL